MPKNLDTRDFSFTRVVSNVAATAAASVSSALPGNHEVRIERVNPFTGSPAHLRSVNAGRAFGLAPGLGAPDQSLITRAIDHVRIAAPALGFASAGGPEFV